MCPPSVGKLEVEFGPRVRLPGDAAGQKNRHKRPTLEQRRMFMALRGVIYMDVEGFKGKA
jgi:hypothetical protein